eukprot:369957-Pyramimonas_sp.AAC.2
MAAEPVGTGRLNKRVSGASPRLVVERANAALRGSRWPAPGCWRRSRVWRIGKTKHRSGNYSREWCSSERKLLTSVAYTES